MLHEKDKETPSFLLRFVRADLEKAGRHSGLQERVYSNRTTPRTLDWGKDKREYVTGGKEHVYLAVNSLNIINSRGIYNLK